ncbi:glycosyltransferase 87 family protein [Allorhizocola rhizosphaerae]|uniref:glycosyltransferase 87 family protein n=1 Tax=Allorhizocola rhizosphaerae TaxID=1872709 RepID=UPI000E3C2E32|nr:glycosyltransferase 87 family protein [Allorhizocola rhizosphaerae]
MRRWVILALITAAATAVFFRLAGAGHNFFDMKIYISAMRWWAAGNDLYDYAQPDFLQGKLYFTYPPFAALLLFPFSFLKLGVTAALFTLGTIVAAGVTTFWIFRALGMERWWLYAVPLVLVLESMREGISFGQINMLLIILIVYDFLILGAKGSKWTGVGIGLATALKLFPGIFIVYFLVTRQWRAAIVSSATAAAATLLAAAIAPRASWDFWTGALWDTARVGRTDYTGNQSLLGMLHRLVVPDQPNRVVWIVLALAAAGFGLWRAAKANSAGDRVAAMALTGLVGGLISPITWPHHLYWFVPALACLLAARQYVPLAVGYLVSVGGAVSLVDWGPKQIPTDTPTTFILRNVLVLLSIALLFLTPIKRDYPTVGAK